jgi:sugar (pentulose or hexulose) kinase
MKPPRRGAPSCLIGLDLGSSAIKGVLTDGKGAVLAEAGTETCLLHPQAGWVEVEPETHYRKVCGILRELAAAAPGEVAALAMAAASGNTLLSGPDGAPLTNIVSWMDERAARQPPAALAGLTAPEVARIAGWPCVNSFPLAHLAWLRERQPELYASAGHYGMDTDWLLFRLAGRWMMDHSTATTFHLQEQTSGSYCEEFLRRLDIPRGKLSPLVRSGVPVGPLTAAAARDTGLSPRTMVVTGCFDHPAAARAVGVREPGALMLSCGTSWVGFTPVMERQAVLDAGLLCDPFLSGEGGPWGGIFSVSRIGRTIDWYVSNVIAPGEREPLRIFDATAAEAAPGAGGLTIDLRQPPRAPSASRANVSRAVMEGAARLLHEKLQALRDRGFGYRRAVMVGGPAGSPVWPGIVAETLGLVVTVGGRSAGARGAALLAGLGVGLTGAAGPAGAGEGG